jgi:hypothetical protein
MTDHETSTSGTEKIAILVDQELYDAITRLLHVEDSVSARVNQFLVDLDNEMFHRRDTIGILQVGHVSDEELQVMERAWEAHYGKITEGYQWERVFLRNSTQLRARYKGKEYCAEVRHNQVWFKDTSVTPSKFASIAANNTTRNAWRDLSVKLLGDDWVRAEVVRQSPPSRRFHDPDAWAEAVTIFNGKEIDQDHSDIFDIAQEGQDND